MAKMLMSSGVAVIGLVLLVACGGSGGEASDPSAADRGRAAEMLRGQWLLVEFRPERALEPMLGGLLAAQIGRLVVTVDRGTITAQGVGIRAQHTYEVSEATGYRAKLMVYDPTRVAYEVWVDLGPDQVMFTSTSEPWRGTGRLTRQY